MKASRLPPSASVISMKASGAIARFSRLAQAVNGSRASASRSKRVSFPSAGSVVFNAT